MRFMRHIGIQTKLPAMILLLVLGSMILAEVNAYRHARSALLEAGNDRLSAVAEGRRQATIDWFIEVEQDVQVQSRNPFVITALRGFRNAWTRVATQHSAPVATLRSALQADDPNAAMSEVAPTYAMMMRRYDSFFTDLIARGGYDDVLLIDQRGQVIFTALKGAEWGQSAVDGPLSDTAMGDIYARAMAATGPNPVYSDFLSYDFDGGEVASFMARPLFSDAGTPIGVIVFRIGAAGLTGILNDRTSLGDTGRAYIVGQDLRTRIGAPPAIGAGSEVDVVRPMVGGAPPVRLDIAPVRRALGGFSGQDTIAPGGVPVIMHYRPLSFLGAKWALIVQQDEAEVAAMEQAVRQVLTRDALILLTAAILLSLLFTRSISRPLVAVEKAMQRIRRGDGDTTIPHINRRDEIGRIARGVSEFRNTLSDNAELAEESSFKGAAFEGSSASLILVNLDLRISYANAAFREMLRAKHDMLLDYVPALATADPVGLSIDVFQPDPEQIRGILSVPDRLPYQADLTIGDTNFALTFSLVRDRSRAPLGYVVEWEDVTERRMRTAVLEAIDTHQIMAEFDMRGNLVNANPAFCALAGKKLGELVGLPLDTLLAPDENTDAANAVLATPDGQTRFCVPGSDRVMEGGMTTVLDRGGAPIRLLLIGQDVTENIARLLASESEKALMIDSQSKVVDTLREALSRLSEGDLDITLIDDFGPDYESLRVDFNSAIETLSEALVAVVHNASSIRAEALEITNAAGDLSTRTEKQAATLEETAAALDQLTGNLAMAADEADQARALVDHARGHAKTSGIVVERAVAAMDEIAHSSDRISRIIGVIDDIAFQTNLLALNAGVEAARAGEAGRGFAVVAQEVRALAQRSADAASEITNLISTSGEHVTQGVDMVDQAGAALRDIVASVDDISDHVGRIARSAAEQSTGLAEINTAVMELDQVTQQNAAMFQETTAASHALTQEAHALSSMVGRFHLNKTRGRVAGDAVAAGMGGASVEASSGASEATQGTWDDTHDRDNTWDNNWDQDAAVPHAPADHMGADASEALSVATESGEDNAVLDAVAEDLPMAVGHDVAPVDAIAGVGPADARASVGAESAALASVGADPADTSIVGSVSAGTADQPSDDPQDGGAHGGSEGARPASGQRQRANPPSRDPDGDETTGWEEF
ncbi:MAG: methyl-accepting chemotaxis protein [Pseudomonadota bacterium]